MTYNKTHERVVDRPTVAQTAKDLGVSENTVRRWIQQGRLTAQRIGPRLLRVDPDSIARLVGPA